MLVGLVTEIKPGERRCALTPAGAAELAGDGNRVLVQQGAGAGAGFADEQYVVAGAQVAGDAEEGWSQAEIVLKGKEAIGSEYPLLRAQPILFPSLHLSAHP